jgi:hypothetical protein
LEGVVHVFYSLEKNIKNWRGAGGFSGLGRFRPTSLGKGYLQGFAGCTFAFSFIFFVSNFCFNNKNCR